jgi:hypothetical protein
VVPGLGLGFGLGFASSDIAVEDGSEDLVRVRSICSVLAAHEDCLPFCIYEGGSAQTSPPQTSQYNSDPYVRACCSRSWCNNMEYDPHKASQHPVTLENSQYILQCSLEEKDDGPLHWTVQKKHAFRNPALKLPASSS